MAKWRHTHFEHRGEMVWDPKHGLGIQTGTLRAKAIAKALNTKDAQRVLALHWPERRR